MAPTARTEPTPTAPTARTEPTPTAPTGRTEPTPTAPTAETPTAPTPEHVDALDLLTGDAQTFRDKVWASQVLLHHTDPDRLVRLLSLDDVDELLTSSPRRPPSVRVSRQGRGRRTRRFTRPGPVAVKPFPGRGSPGRVLDLLEGGA